MKAMVLAAGQGSRLYPLTDRMPKPMIALGGRPVLEHAVLLLQRHCITDITINLHHLPRAITDYFGDGSRWDVRITYSFEQELLGTAGAVKKLETSFDRTFLVLYGDNLTDCDLTRLCETHRARGGTGTLSVYGKEGEDIRSSGLVRMDEEDRITEFVEKPKPEEVFDGGINGGIYVLEPKVFRYIPSDRPYDFARHVFPHMLEAGEPLYAYRMTERLIAFDTPEKYRSAQQELERRPLKANATVS